MSKSKDKAAQAAETPVTEQAEPIVQDQEPVAEAIDEPTPPEGGEVLPLDTEADAPKAAETPAAPQRYRIREGAPVHYVHNRLFKPGEVITLPEGVKPGMWLDAVDA